MNGATALDWEKTINSPNSTNTITIGTSQYFFSCFRICRNSDNTLPLLIRASEHPLETTGIATALRVRLPAAPRFAAARQRTGSSQAPDEADRRQQEEEQQR